MMLHIGTSGYSYAPWKGKFYPARLPAKDMLGYYAGHFGTVEINSSFYRMPTPAVLATWAAQVPAQFQFAFKAPRRITHDRKLAGVAEDVKYFLDATQSLGARCGPLLFQLPPNAARDLPRLEAFLELLPREPKIAFGFRHSSWYDADVQALLRRHGRALWVEEDDEATTPLTATADWGYLRLRRAEYSENELADWLARIRSQSWTQAYIYFKHEDEARGPAFAQRFAALAFTE